MSPSYLVIPLSASPRSFSSGSTPLSDPHHSSRPLSDPHRTSSAVLSAALVVPLGITTENTSAERKRRVRRRRATAQMVAGRLLPRLMVCGRQVLPGRGMVEVVEQPGQEGCATFRGLAVCGLGWSCAFCASRIAAVRRAELAAGVDVWSVAGGCVVLVTLTFRHGYGDNLVELMASFRKALNALDSGRWAQAFRAEHQIAGQVRALEVLFGRSNGFHPHSHQILWCETVPDLVKLEADLTARWLGVLAKQGLSGLEGIAVDVRLGHEAVASYLAKAQWSVADEVAAGSSGKGGAGGLYSPFEMLDVIADRGPDAALFRAKFQEYCVATRGRHQLRWSSGLRKRLGLDEVVSDEAVAADDGDEAVVLALIPLAGWRLVLRYEAQEATLSAAEVGGQVAVDELLRGLSVRCGPAPGRGPPWPG